MVSKVVNLIKKILGLSKCIWVIELYDSNSDIIAKIKYDESCIFEDVIEFASLMSFRYKKCRSFNVMQVE